MVMLLIPVGWTAGHRSKIVWIAFAFVLRFMTVEVAEITSCIVCFSGSSPARFNDNQKDCMSNDTTVLSKFIMQCNRVPLLASTPASSIGCQQLIEYQPDGVTVKVALRTCEEWARFADGRQFPDASINKSLSSPAGIDICPPNATMGSPPTPLCICTSRNNCNDNCYCKATNGITPSTDTASGNPNVADPPVQPGGALPVAGTGASSGGSCRKKKRTTLVIPIIGICTILLAA